MHKQLSLLTLALVICMSASAQFQYRFKDTTTPYVPLSGATSVNGSTIWDEEDFTVSMPFSWKLDSTLIQNDFKLSLSFFGVYDDPTSISDLNGFVFGDMDVADRGTLAGTASLSPIRYLTTGTAPNRIFKLEFANAGFYGEYDNYNTMDDSFSLQIWIYEKSNILEYHYGPSKISHPSDYFSINGAGPFVGYAKHVDFDAGSGGYLYYLKGTAASPGLDTNVIPNFPTVALNSWPANGKVYRFTPLSVPVPCLKPTPNYTAGTPSGKTVQYTYTGTTSPLDSLVWDFGDATKQKITTAFTTPISHTFASDGKYNVCVTAYNTCGSNAFCAQLALAVGNFTALGDIKVYPNPTDNFITIEGMKAGGTATVLSVTGQAVLNVAINSGKQALDISALPSGTYMLLLANSEGVRGATSIIRR